MQKVSDAMNIWAKDVVVVYLAVNLMAVQITTAKNQAMVRSLPPPLKIRPRRRHAAAAEQKIAPRRRRGILRRRPRLVDLLRSVVQ